MSNKKYAAINTDLFKDYIWFMAAIALLFAIMTAAIDARAQSMPPGCWIDPGGEGDVVWCPAVQVFLPLVAVSAPVVIGDGPEEPNHE